MITNICGIFKKSGPWNYQVYGYRIRLQTIYIRCSYKTSSCYCTRIGDQFLKYLTDIYQTLILPVKNKEVKRFYNNLKGEINNIILIA